MTDALTASAAPVGRPVTADATRPAPRLRYDNVARRVVAGVRNALDGAVPDGLAIVFTVTAPVRKPSKVVEALADAIRTQLSASHLPGEQARTLAGNQVRIRVVASRAPYGASVTGLVHNPDPPPDDLLDRLQSLLERGEPASAADHDLLASYLARLRAPVP